VARDIEKADVAGRRAKLAQELRTLNFAGIDRGQIEHWNFAGQRNLGMIFAMQIIRQSAFTAAPWKNGGGVTHEAIRMPASGDPYRWRVSVAHIDRSGPFSDFAAYHRIMVLLKGRGAALKFANGDERLLSNVGDLAQFDGALAAQCELKSGPCVDLNLMVAKSLQGVEASVRRLSAALELPAARGRSTLIFPIDAPLLLHAGAGDAASLEPWDLAVISDSDGPANVAAAAAAALVFVASVPR
jgi:environmental stress-induced protein Ves